MISIHHSESVTACTGDVLGVISGIISPIVAFVIWMAITYSYRAQFAKRRIVLEVVKRVKLEDISSQGHVAASLSGVHDVSSRGLASARSGAGLEVTNGMFVNPAAAVTEPPAARPALRQLSGKHIYSSNSSAILRQHLDHALN